MGGRIDGRMHRRFCFFAVIYHRTALTVFGLDHRTTRENTLDLFRALDFRLSTG